MQFAFFLALFTGAAAILPPSSRIEKERTTAAAAAPATVIYDTHLGPDGRLRPLQQEGEQGESNSLMSLRPEPMSAVAAALQRRAGEAAQETKGVARRPEILLPEDDEAYDIRLTTLRPRRTTAESYQDYPDYELPLRAGWPPLQEMLPYGERPPPLRPLQQVQQPRPIVEQMPTAAAAPIDDYRLPAVVAAAPAPLPPLRFRQRRPNDVWIRTNGAYPEFVNLNSIGEMMIEYRRHGGDGSSIPDIGLPPISDPVVPLLPVDNYPAIPYPELRGYPDRQPPPYDTYENRYRNRPVRVVDSSGYGARYVEPRYAIRERERYGTQSGGSGPPAGGYGRREEYGIPAAPAVPSLRSYPPPPVEGGGRGWRETERSTIPSPYGYSYAGYIQRQSRMYPIMIYTLESCPACHSAKRLLAVNYADVASHFLELVGEEEWQRQLHIDLQNLTGAGKFPYVFVCGQFIGGSMDLHELHGRGQLRQMLQRCNRERSYTATAADAVKTVMQR